MADDELQAIRAQRMAAMRQQQQQSQGDPGQVFCERCVIQFSFCHSVDLFAGSTETGR